jgi:hypothetical protein
MTPTQKNTASAVRTGAPKGVFHPLRDVGSDVAHLSLTAWVNAVLVACLVQHVPTSLNLPDVFIREASGAFSEGWA